MEPQAALSPRATPQLPTQITSPPVLGSSAASSVSSSPREGERNEQRPEQRLKDLQQAAIRPDIARRTSVLPKKTVNLDKVLDPSKRRIKEDIIRIIVQYLRSEGYGVSAVTLQDEANVRLMEDHAYQSTIKKLKKAIIDGDWAEVERLSAKPSFRNQQSFLYAIYRQQYLELIERQEYQKAFTYLQKKLKPLEAHQTYAGEFRDLCYLLTCKSVQDIPGLRWWDGEKGSSREKLIEHFQSLLEFEALETSGAQAHVPDARLLTLLRQAAAYQIEFSRYRPRASPSLSSLLSDYACYVLPNAPKTLLGGHKGNVKCVEFVGEEGNLIASGSSDNTVRLWSSEDGRCVRVLGGHTSRVWSVASSRAGNLLVTASGDATACVYDIKGESTQPKLRLRGHEADVYSVALHPAEAHVATAGYDRGVRLFDMATGKLLKTFAGHTSSVATAIFNPYGNLIISGSKDSTIKFWDVTSGLCVRTFSSYLGEVTSLQANPNGSLLLSASKDNSNRLWDLKMGKPIKRFKGHQNTSKNFIRCRYGSLQSVVISGSEDGVVYAWDADAGALVERLTGHVGPVYSVAWNEKQSLLVSCGHDCSVRLWTFEERAEQTEPGSAAGLSISTPVHTSAPTPAPAVPAHTSSAPPLGASAPEKASAQPSSPDSPSPGLRTSANQQSHD